MINMLHIYGCYGNRDNALLLPDNESLWKMNHFLSINECNCCECALNILQLYLYVLVPVTSRSQPKLMRWPLSVHVTTSRRKHTLFSKLPDLFSALSLQNILSSSHVSANPRARPSALSRLNANRPRHLSQSKRKYFPFKILNLVKTSQVFKCS